MNAGTLALLATLILGRPVFPTPQPIQLRTTAGFYQYGDIGCLSFTAGNTRLAAPREMRAARKLVVCVDVAGWIAGFVFDRRGNILGNAHGFADAALCTELCVGARCEKAGC